MGESGLCCTYDLKGAFSYITYMIFYEIWELCPNQFLIFTVALTRFKISQIVVIFRQK